METPSHKPISAASDKPGIPAAVKSLIVRRRKFLIVAAAFCLLGATLLARSHAANLAISLEAEDGNTTGNLGVGPSQGASKGSIVFGATGGTPNPTPTPTPTPPGGGGNNDPTANTCNSFSMVGAPPELSAYKPNQCEDFNSGLGGFQPYTGGGDGTVVDGSSRKPSQCSNGGGFLALKQSSDGSTCGGSLPQPEQQYGYWEARMREFNSGGSGEPGHPVLIIWDKDQNWPNGEMDFVENDVGEQPGGYLHCIGHPSDNCYTMPNVPFSVDMTQWHVYGFEWKADGGAGYIDGKKWWSASNNDWSIQSPGHMTIQLDCIGCGTPVKDAEMDVDWVHTYK